MSYLALRQLLGWLGVCLPVVIIGFGWLHHRQVFTSISAYYYTIMGEILVAMLVTIGIFLIAYRGYPKREGEWISDNMLANIAGSGAIFVALFPTTLDCELAYGQPPHIGLRTYCAPEIGTFEQALGQSPEMFLQLQGWFAEQIEIPDWIGYVHFASAAAFFIAIAMMTGVHFRREVKGAGAVEPIKRTRSRVFLACSFGMMACVVLIALWSAWTSNWPFVKNLLPELRKAIAVARPVLVLEAIAVLLFGFAWLVKGRQILDDHEGEQSPPAIVIATVENPHPA